MALPEHWWLLVQAVLGQAAFFARMALAMRRSEAVPAWAIVCLALGAGCGLVYGWLLRDAVLAAGQAGILLLAWVGRNTNNH